MKKLVLILALVVSFISCNTTSKTTNSTKETVQKSQDTVRIANDSIEYEIIIFEPGFNSWLETRKSDSYFNFIICSTNLVF